jgi:oligopeptide/dipeptide ABC transporter ATP-binding protein
VKNLSIGFHSNGAFTGIIDDVSFSMKEGELFGLAGESGCGKTVTALSILRLLPRPICKITGGSILYQGRDLLRMSQEELRDLRGNEISMVFQEPTSSLNPLLTVKQQLEESFMFHAFKGEPMARIKGMLERVGFSDPGRVLLSYPHELSGGMMQRVMIAMALLLNPRLIIADEPTTALDVTVQAQIMELLVELQQEFGAAVLLITHNLNLIAQYAGRMAVMYAGRMVEESDVNAMLTDPQHPYTRGLLAALPDLHAETAKLEPIPGQVPQPSEFEPGCRFRPRCSHAMDACIRKPELAEAGEGRKVACFLYKDDDNEHINME